MLLGPRLPGHGGHFGGRRYSCARRGRTAPVALVPAVAGRGPISGNCPGCATLTCRCLARGGCSLRPDGSRARLHRALHRTIPRALVCGSGLRRGTLGPRSRTAPRPPGRLGKSRRSASRRSASRRGRRRNAEPEQGSEAGDTPTLLARRIEQLRRRLVRQAGGLYCAADRALAHRLQHGQPLVSGHGRRQGSARGVPQTGRQLGGEPCPRIGGPA